MNDRVVPRGSERHAFLNFRTAFVLLAAPLVVWAELLLVQAAGVQYLFLGLSLMIAVAASAAGFRVVLFVIASAALAIDYFVVGPGALLHFASSVEAAALATFVAGWVGVAAVLHRLRVATRREHESRTKAERTATQARRVAQLVMALGRARSSHDAIETSVQESLHALHADSAMMLLIADDAANATVVRAVGYESNLVTRHLALSSTGVGPVRDTVLRRTVMVLESLEARTSEYGQTADELVGRRYSAVATVPLVIAGRVAAVIRLDFADQRAFTVDDHDYLDALGTHAAHALERTWEQEANERAVVEAGELRARADQELTRRQVIEQALRASETRYRALATRTTRLHALTAALSEAVTTRAVATAIVQHASVVVGATAADVWLLTDDGAHFEVGAPDAKTTSSSRVIAVEAGLYEADVIRMRQPLFISSWDEAQDQYWRSAGAAADAAYVSSTGLPLLIDGVPAGVLRFDFSVPVNFDDEYRALLVSVAQHCSQALDRARLYESAQRARAEAETASRLKDDFLSIVSHELRTPLNAVLGWASMLQKGTVDSALARRAVQSIRDNATRQASLIDDLLDLSRIAAGRATLDLQEIDLTALVAGVVESLVPVASSNHVELQLEQFPPTLVTGDRRRLEQVFFNLIGNALKFTRAGGWVRVEAHIDGAAARVRVRDNGVGIDADFLPHVFERFRQADTTSTRAHGGLGLGLSIAKQLVEAHKGNITVESAGQGRGSVFTVELPLLAGSPAREWTAQGPARPSVADMPRLTGTHVLIVDDEADAREIMTYALADCGATVKAAANAEQAFSLLGSERFNVLVADIAMPGENGCSLIRRVREAGDARIACIPAAAVTAHAREAERQEVLAAGFHLHLPKPVDPRELARVVGELARVGAGEALATC